MPTTFAKVIRAARQFPDMTPAQKYDGSPVLKVQGTFVAGVATHPSAEPDSLVVRIGLEEREWLLDDAPDIYYLTDYYRKHPVVLARLSALTEDAVRDLLSGSLTLALKKVRHPRAHHHPRNPAR